MDISRRKFFSIVAAPAIVPIWNLMPIKPIPFTPYMLVEGSDGFSDIEKKIYEHSTLDNAFLSVDFLDKYEVETRGLVVRKSAIISSINEELSPRFAEIHKPCGQISGKIISAVWGYDGPLILST